MSAVEAETTLPQFAHAVPGYDRVQVDEYISRLNEWASGAQARAKRAEALAAERDAELRLLREELRAAQSGPANVHPESANEQAVKGMPEQATEVVADALAEADEIRRRAIAYGETVLADAHREAAEVVESSKRYMTDLAEKAATEHRAARAERAVIVGQLSKLLEIHTFLSADGGEEPIDRPASAEADG